MIFAAVLLVLVLVIAGCAGPGGSKTLTDTQFTQLGKDMVSIEKSSTTAQNTLYDSLDKIYNDKTGKSPDERARARFLQGYIDEYQSSTTTASGPRAPKYTDAYVLYQDASKLRSSYSLQAIYRSGVLGAQNQLGPDTSVKTAKASLSTLERNYSTPQNTFDLWVREAAPSRIPPDAITPTALAGVGGSATLVDQPTETGTAGPVLQRHEMADTALRQVDTVYKTSGGLDTTYYRGVDAIVGFFERIVPNKSAAIVIMLFILSALVKLVTMPLTTMSYRGMRDMQRIQPMLKEIQEKYKDDRAKLAEEQMKLMKAHKVSPAGGCLPMLIQLPIFIAVYQAVRVYSFQFSDTHFLWIGNLARPDLILLILYAISMIVTQKLTATPATDPQQQALQNQMTYMMPIFLVLVLYSIASAFLLYWFFLNVMSSAHQYYLLRKFKAEETARDAVESPAPEPPAKRRKKGTQ